MTTVNFVSLVFSVLVALNCRLVKAIPLFENARQTVPPGCTAATFTKALPSYAFVASQSPYTENSDPYQVLQYLPSSLMSNVCAVKIGVMLPGSTNTFYLEVWLPPKQKWNQRFLTVGNSGFLGGVSRKDMFARVVHGFATMSTDTGHPELQQSDPSQLSWALNTTNKANGIDKQIDWGYRALNESIPLAKKLINTYYSIETPALGNSHSYYSGCSTGGRQGLKQIQIAADSFDGVLVGAPAWDLKHLMPWVSKLADYNLPTSKSSDFKLEDPAGQTGSKFKTIGDFIMLQCDVINGIDDVQDNIISAPKECADILKNSSIWTGPSGIVCGSPNAPAAPNCVTTTQKDMVLDLVNDTTVSSSFVFEGYDISATPEEYTYLDDPAPAGFDQDWAKYFLLQDGQASLDSTQWSKNADKIVQMSDEWDRTVGHGTADQYKLDQSFEGKIILYHGLADGFIPRRSSERYYTSTQSAYGGDVSSWFRYFQIPGMQHCFQLESEMNSYKAPWYFGGVGLDLGGNGNTWYVPPNAGLNDTNHDALLALADWVENGRAVDRINITAFESGTFEDGTYKIFRQRPICPYPQAPKWDGVQGTENALDHWRCA